MISHYTSRWIRFAVLSLSALLALVLVGSVAAASQCKKINGKLTLQALPSSTCSSDISLCARATLSGDLAGVSSFTGTSQAATADTPTTSVILLTGDNAIHTSAGTLLTKDAGDTDADHRTAATVHESNLPRRRGCAHLVFAENRRIGEQDTVMDAQEAPKCP